MQKVVAVSALALALLVGLPAAAPAARVKQRGELVGAEQTRVAFSIVKRRGKLRRVTTIRFRNVPVSCADGNTGTLNINATSTRIHGSRFVRGGRLLGEKLRHGRLRVVGTVKRRGRAAHGKLEAKFRKPDGALCATGELRWRTHRR